MRDWHDGYGLTNLLARFAGSEHWDDPELLMRAYDSHVTGVRTSVPADRLLEWRATDGWDRICRALDVPVPGNPFPWRNRREDWS